MSSIKSFLSKDHKECDELFADFENSVYENKTQDAQNLYSKMGESFLHHFKMEEEVLFPSFEAKSGMSCGPTQVMRMEHEQMKMTLDKIANAVEKSDKDAILGLCETFNILVQQHNSKEEQILYTMADNFLSEDIPQVIENMKNA